MLNLKKVSHSLDIADEHINVSIGAEEQKQDAERLSDIALSEPKIPDKYFFNTNLQKALPDYHERRKNAKNSVEIMFWNQKISELLAVYDPQEDKYYFKLVRAVCQIVEDYFVYDKKLGDAKKSVVLSVCLPFFDNNRELLEKVIENELENVVKSTFFRRVCAKFEIFFFRVFLSK